MTEICINKMKVYYCKYMYVNKYMYVVCVNTIYYRWKLERKGFLCCGDKHSAATLLPKRCLGFSVALNTASVAAVALLIN